MSSVNIAESRFSRQEDNFLLQDEFFIKNGQNVVQVKLTYDALTWTTSTKRGFVLRRLFSDSATLVEDDQHFLTCDDNEASHLRTSHSYPNGFFSSKRANHRLSISDIVGCELARGSSAQDRAVYLRIYAYPLLKKFLWKDSVRKRREIVFGFNKEADFQKNHEEIAKWQNGIKKCIKKQSTDTLELHATEPTDDRKKLLIFINPFSGAGKSLDTFKSRIVPILAESKVPYETVVTKYNGHARDVVSELDLIAWGGIVVVSGDGLIYEVINGLMGRPDRLDAIKIPIGALPGGSGNALVSSILYQAGEVVKHTITRNASLLMIKNRIQPMDLVALDMFRGGRLYSFLSVAWGIVADVDLESEKYRNLGKARFTVGALARILGLRKYSGRIHFLPINPAYRSKWSSYDKSPCEISTSGNRQEIESDSTRQMKPSSSFVCSSDDSNSEQEVPTPLLSPIDQPVPNNWVTMSATDFVSVTAIYQTHLAQDMLVFPHSRLKDGCIYLAITRGDVSRYKVLQLFNAMQTGELEILEQDCCEVIKVAAFRLEPDEEPKGVIMVDGEKVDYGPIQGQVIEGLARVFA